MPGPLDFVFNVAMDISDVQRQFGNTKKEAEKTAKVMENSLSNGARGFGSSVASFLTSPITNNVNSYLSNVAGNATAYMGSKLERSADAAFGRGSAASNTVKFWRDEANYEQATSSARQQVEGAVGEMARADITMSDEMMTKMFRGTLGKEAFVNQQVSRADSAMSKESERINILAFQSGTWNAQQYVLEQKLNASKTGAWR